MSVLRQKVLQLNAAYEPDAVIDVMRALGLVYRRRVAHAEEFYPDLFVHTRLLSYQAPSVIRVITYHDLRRRRRESSKMRQHIFMRDRFRCQYCALKVGQLHPALRDERGRPRRLEVQDLTLDHIDPQSRGGLNEPENLATCCGPCNQRKANRTPDEARMPLLSTPAALRYGLDRAHLRHFAETRPQWRPYLEPYVFVDEKVA